MRSPRRPSRHLPRIEPLESRIAPASLTVTAFDYNNVVNAKTNQLIPGFFLNAASTSLGAQNLAIAKTVGQASNVYFTTLTPGENLQVYTTQTGAESLVNVSQGTVVVFFTDLNLTNSPTDQVVANQLSGVALGNKTAVVISGGVSGDIVTDYNDGTGQLGGTFATRGHPAISETPGSATMLLPNTVLSLVVAGDVGGSFIAGGAVNFFQATVGVSSIKTGTAANGYIFDFDPGVTNTTGNTTLNVPLPAARVAGPSISEAIVGALTNFAGTTPQTQIGTIVMGQGGPEAAGGSINSLTLLNQLSGASVTGGQGGIGISGAPVGGPGGSITTVIVNGPLGSASATANAAVSFTGGAGGSGFGTARGGAGGAVRNVDFGYTDTNGSIVASPQVLPANLAIQGGNGGDGGLAGAGGSLTNINVLVSTPNDTIPGVITPEFTFAGGAGGDAPLGGRAGGGGSITSLSFSNLSNNPAVPPDQTVVNSTTGFATSQLFTYATMIAGAGGNATISGLGGAGGSVSGLTVKGYNFTILGGAGGDGVRSGGAGGGVSGINVVGSAGALPNDDIHDESLFIGGGAGGNGSAGPGGTGGSVNGLTVSNADFGPSSFGPNALAATTGFLVLGGTGGNAGAGAAGAGGSTSHIQVTEVDFLSIAHPGGDIGTINITAGNGGSSPVSRGVGGAGGAVNTVVFSGAKVGSSAVTAGAGGSGGGAGLTGRGGAGGSITSVSIRNAETLIPSTVTSGTNILADPTANFVGATTPVVIGDPILNTTTQAVATVTGVTATELSLSSDIFAAGDGYELTVETAFGTAADPAAFLNDPLATFVTANVKVGDPIVDTTTGASTTVTTVVSNTELVLAGDIFAPGDKYSLTNEAKTGTATNPVNVVLTDPNATFQTSGVAVGNTVVDNTSTPNHSFTVTRVLSDSQLDLTPVTAGTFFSVNDKYTISAESLKGTNTTGVTFPATYQNTLTDSATNFNGLGVVPGDIVEDTTDNPPETAVVLPSTAAHPNPSILGTTLLLSADIVHAGDSYTITSVASVVSAANYTAGNGGAGFLTGGGGIGGSILDSSAFTAGPVAYLGGAGGNGGASGAAGAGGSLIQDGIVSSGGSSSMTAGSAGSAGLIGAAGGNISSANIQSDLGVSLIGGNGYNGGVGGSIRSSGYTGAPTNGNFTLDPPEGNITVQAGNGGPYTGASTTRGAGGAGGSIVNVTGFVSGEDPVVSVLQPGDDFYTTQFVAGSGGNGVSSAGAGGSVTGVNFFGGGGNHITFYINAGDAGNSSARVGAPGGNVSLIGGSAFSTTSGNVDFSINPATDFHHISAGNGGNASLIGGLGGSVFDVFVNDASIGIRTGVAFGFDLAAGSGGISAGAGGTGLTPALAGLAGNVTDISAGAIASIVAGHINSGQGLEADNLANVVSRIILSGTVAPATAAAYPLVLTFDNQADASLTHVQTTSSPLSTNSTGLQVSSALNVLSEIVAAGGVLAAQEPNGYKITFQNPSSLPSGANNNVLTAFEPVAEIAGNSYPTTELTKGVKATSTSEVQDVEIFASDSFSLSFGIQNTVPLPAGASAGAVQAALNALPLIVNLGGVTVTTETTTPIPGYTITFAANAGVQALLRPNYVYTETISAATNSITLTAPARGDLIPSQIATANFVGSIKNLLAQNATTFHYSNSSSPFAFGDVPIDGLIAATNLEGSKNFIPEAYVTEVNGAAALIDNTVS